MKKNKQKTSKLLGICCTSLALFVLSCVNIFAKSSGCSPTSSNLEKVACDSFRVGGDKFTSSGIYTVYLINSVGCDSIVTLDLTINVTPSAPMLTSTSVCGEGVDTLNVLQIGRVNMPNPFVYTWYDAEVDGNIVGNGEQFITPNLTQTTPYYATLSYMGCESEKNSVFAIVKSLPNAPALTSTSVCGEGVDTLKIIPIDNSRLNVGNPYLYTWYDAAVDGNVVGTGEQFITPNLTQTTAYFATLTYKGCESARRGVEATVNFIPSKPYVAESNPVCGEGSFTFEAMMPARINCRNCDPFDYEWTNSNGDVVGIAPVYSTGNLSSSASYFVTTSYNGCKSEATVVWAEVLNIPAPSITESNPFACFGLPTELQVANAVPTRVTDCRGCNEMYDYTWYNENEDSVGTTSSFTTPILMEPSIYYLVASDRGCKSLPTKIEIAVKQIPVITQSPNTDTYLCPSETLINEVVATGEDLSYTWVALPNFAQISNTQILVVPNMQSVFDNANYLVVVTNQCGADTSDLLRVHIPTVDTSVIFLNGVLTANNSEANSYTWLDADNGFASIDGATSQSFTPVANGHYAVLVEQFFAKHFSCADTSNVHTFNILTNINSSNSSKLSVYPNPASDVVNVTLPSSINGGIVSISDIHGNEVVSKSVSGLEFSISTSDLSSGVYILKVSSSILTATKQIVVVK